MVQGGKGMLLGGFSDFLEHCQVGIHSLYLIKVTFTLPNLPISSINACVGLLQHHIRHAYRCNAEYCSRESGNQDGRHCGGAASRRSYQTPSHMDQRVGWSGKQKEEFMEMLSVSADRFDVCIILYLSSALSPTCHFLIPNLLSADVFPNVSAISLHLLDLDGNEEGLQQQRRETEDLALRLLHQV